MDLGTIDRTPPPFFRQGLPALARLVLCAALALFLMVADARFAVVDALRSSIATALLPVQQVLAVPVNTVLAGARYAEGLDAARAAEAAARLQLTAQATELARARQLDAENRRLRALLALAPALPVSSVAAEITREAADPYTRQVFINRGSHHGVVAGAPVVSEAGVLGQVVRVYPLTAQVALLVDKDAAIPVLDTRSGLRAAAQGTGDAMTLRFVQANSDVRPGDVLRTSGVDGIYPAALAVARVTAVDARGDSGFAAITLAPLARPEGVRHVLVLMPLMLAMPDAASAPEAAGPASVAQPLAFAASSASTANAVRAVGAGAAVGATSAAQAASAPRDANPLAGAASDATRAGGRP